ncbi:MAG TPA: ABC transporter ATP-binding protein, partial [Candidatus Acutalibacter ornithocaccae]|nr:ABC transporter ATP-binding protein [Candidatus Acutalibacter ornithocaccae]
LRKPDEVVKVLEECRDKNGKLDEKKACLKLIDAFTISMFTAKKLFSYHVESGKELSGEISALQAKAEAARKSAQASGGELNENFELVKNGQVVTEVRKMTKEEIDLTVRRVSRIVKIGMFMDRYPAELSGGQQQRVAIARTLAPEPSVLFMDEPLSNLDAKLRLEMRYELQRLHLETGSTFVYVTHDQMEAMTLATQICLIDNGVLQQYDAPLTVYHQPSNLFVADFVGNPSINFVEASGEQQEDGSVALTLFRNRRARFRPARPLDLKSWFQARDREAQERAELRRKQAADKNYVEKGNKDEVFRYHIAKVVEEDDSLQEEPVLTNQDLVLGVRPEFLDIEDSGSLDGEIYGAMPTGMESTIKVRVDDFLLTGVVFGSTLFSLGAKVRLNISSDNIMLFDRQSGRCITQGSLEFLQV